MEKRTHKETLETEKWVTIPPLTAIRIVFMDQETGEIINVIGTMEEFSAITRTAALLNPRLVIWDLKMLGKDLKRIEEEPV